MIQLPPELWSIIFQHKRKQHFNLVSKYIELLIPVKKMDWYSVHERWEYNNNTDLMLDRSNKIRVLGYDPIRNIRYFIYLVKIGEFRYSKRCFYY